MEIYVGKGDITGHSNKAKVNSMLWSTSFFNHKTTFKEEFVA